MRISDLNPLKDNRIQVFSDDVIWYPDKTNYYLYCYQCWLEEIRYPLLTVYELWDGTRDIWITEKGCRHLKFVKQPSSTEKIIAKVLTKAGWLYLVPKKS